jgi:hypothetical protein
MTWADGSTTDPKDTAVKILTDQVRPPGWGPQGQGGSGGGGVQTMAETVGGHRIALVESHGRR